ncbi:MAG: hypothetical protein RJA83_582 [Pseudomonadota bacterium]|jgi:hypothetical protein
MPKKKNKNQNNETPLEKLAKKILVNSQKGFYFGANNKGSVPHSNIQAMFIHELLDDLSTKTKLNLNKFSFTTQKKIRGVHKNYVNEKNVVQGLFLVSLLYSYSDLKHEFKKQKGIEWNEDWFADLNLIWATACLEQYLKNEIPIFSFKDTLIYKKLRLDGVPDQGNEREIYFKRTFFDLEAATLHGTGACELMAEFALFDAIRMSKTLDCPIHYIRFLTAEYQEIRYQEINAIALGDWPNEDALIVCPWLEKGENLIWKRDIQNTIFANYPEADIKIIFKIFPGAEMDQWREKLAKVDFIAETEEKRAIRNRIEKLSEKYQKGFDKCFLNKNVDENQSAPSISFRR